MIEQGKSIYLPPGGSPRRPLVCLRDIMSPLLPFIPRGNATGGNAQSKNLPQHVITNPSLFQANNNLH